jgi:hypothetical protein
MTENATQIPIHATGRMPSPRPARQPRKRPKRRGARIGRAELEALRQEGRRELGEVPARRGRARQPAQAQCQGARECAPVRSREAGPGLLPVRDSIEAALVLRPTRSTLRRCSRASARRCGCSTMRSGRRHSRDRPARRAFRSDQARGDDGAADREVEPDTSSGDPEGLRAERQGAAPGARRRLRRRRPTAE